MVRKAAGIGFDGTDPEFAGYSILAELAQPNMREAGRHFTAEGMYAFTSPGTIAVVDFDGGAFHRSSAITRDHVERVLRRMSGTDVAVTDLALATTWTDRAYQATAYRKGRVLDLVARAGRAHATQPKLACARRHHARPRRDTGWRDLLRRARLGRLAPPRSRPRPCLGGRSVPDFAWSDGTRVGSLMRDGRGLLLDFDRCPARRTLAACRSARIGYVAGDVENRLGLHALLVRPDGIVAWASDTACDDTDLTQSLAQWFGE